MNEQLPQLLSSHEICVRCVGRCIGSKGSVELDSSIATAQDHAGELLENCVPEPSCSLCHGLVKRSIEYTDRITDELDDLEFETFLVGCALSNYDQADSIPEQFGFSPISLKFEIRKEIGLRITKKLGKNVEFQHPDISIIFDPNRMEHSLEIRSLYLLARYRKLVRGIPQTKWPCTHCKGRGCQECSNTGQQYPSSVELEVSQPFLAASKAADSSFHGAGREDIDALMLGTGRPFVLELKDPKIRTLDLKTLEKEVNRSSKVQITDLQYTDKDMIAFLKQGSPNAWKRYRARVQTGTELHSDQIKMLNQWGRDAHQLEQRTPQRVSHRRANKVRKKTIYSLVAKILAENIIELEIHAQGGAYIKEFISGDEGRTSPSVADLLRTSAICTALDVIGVDDRGIFQS